MVRGRSPRPSWWTSRLALWLLCACAEREPEPESCVGASAAPLFHGSPQPDGLRLGAGERSAILSVLTGRDRHVCTATLIARDWAITAAHCLMPTGTTLASTGHGEVRYEAISAMTHAELDVALIALERLGDVAATPIALWRDTIGPSWTGVRATLAGTGRTESGSTGELRFVDEAIVEVNERELRVDGMATSGACDGDSGGPLLVADSSGRARLAGVLDRGTADCLGLDVYTRADVLRDWVDRLLGDAPACARDGGR